MKGVSAKRGMNYFNSKVLNRCEGAKMREQKIRGQKALVVQVRDDQGIDKRFCSGDIKEAPCFCHVVKRKVT